MKRIMILLAALVCVAGASAQNDRDWANFGRYAAENKALKEGGTPPRVVFMGNSITEGWVRQSPAFFTDNNYTGRGISGQVTAQMLARMRPDVIGLAPRAVVILAGTNDIAGNDGYVSIENIAGNIFSMAELAKTHGIKVFICSTLPAAHYPWKPEITDVPEKVKALNALLERWSRRNRCTWVNFWSPMVDERGGLPPALAGDGIHPTDEGYRVMEEILQPLLQKGLLRR